MSNAKPLEFDKIGYWSEIKLDIVNRYAGAYSKTLSSQRDPALYHVYIDAFSGAGVPVSHKTREFTPGNALSALTILPPFRQYYFIDIRRDKIAAFKDIVRKAEEVHIYQGDANSILISKVFPDVRFEDHRRGLCLLDPYGLYLNWEVIRTAGWMRSIDMFLNFPIMDINRNVLWRNPEGVGPHAIRRMNAFWGDESWREIAYTTDKNLFGYLEKEDNETIAKAFRKRLQTVGGFHDVAEPLPMRNARGATVYYLFFASQKPVAKEIVQDILAKYKARGER